MNTKPLWSVQIELTNHCNYRCAFCPQAYYKNKDYTGTPFDRKKGYMEFDLFKRVVNQCKQYAQEINFSFFGEPTLHPRYFEYIRWLKNRGDLRVVFNTNLSMVTMETFNLWNEIKVDQCRFSVDADSAETYELVRPGGKIKQLGGQWDERRPRWWTVVCKMIHWFDTPHRPTRHVYVVCEKNKHEVESYVRRWAPVLGPNDEIVVKNVLTYGGVINPKTPGFDKFCHSNPCNVWSQPSLTVDWQGNVTPCNLDVNMGLTIGNIKDKSLKELYRGPEWERIKKLSIKREISPCKTCIDANNWTQNIVIRQGDKFDPTKLSNFHGNRPKFLPKGNV